MTNVYILAMTFIIALFLGSFFNVVGLRVLKKENISFPPSHCTSCNHRLGILDLIPVFSWVFLKGECRYCKDKISKIYPFGEILTALSYTAVVYSYGITIETIPHIILVTILVMATVSDLKEMEVPDVFSIIGFVLILIFRIIISVINNDIGLLLPYVIGSVVSFVMLYLLYSIGGMGGADVMLYAVIGLALGISNSVLSLMYASIVATIYHLPQIIKKEKESKSALPFVPFIAIGVLITYIIPFSKLIDILY